MQEIDAVISKPRNHQALDGATLGAVGERESRRNKAIAIKLYFQLRVGANAQRVGRRAWLPVAVDGNRIGNDQR